MFDHARLPKARKRLRAFNGKWQIDPHNPIRIVRKLFFNRKHNLGIIPSTHRPQQQMEMINSQKPTVQLKSLQPFAHPQILDEQITKYPLLEIRVIAEGFGRDEIYRIVDADTFLGITVHGHTKYSSKYKKRISVYHDPATEIKSHDLPTQNGRKSVLSRFSIGRKRGFGAWSQSTHIHPPHLSGSMTLGSPDFQSASMKIVM